MRERLNLRFLTRFLICCLLFCAGWYIVHRIQWARASEALLKSADLAEAEDNPSRAARFLGLYVQTFPERTEAKIRYANLLEKLATSPRALYSAAELLEDVLRREPQGHDDLRRRLIQLDVKLNLLDQAFEHIKILGQKSDNDPELDFFKGRYHEARGDYVVAVDLYKKSIKAKPDQIDPYERLALVLRDQLNRPNEADQCLAEMVKANKDNTRAHAARARFYLSPAASLEQEKMARDEAETALKLAPDDEIALLLAAETGRKKDPDTSRKRLLHFQTLYPQDVRGYEGLAILEVGAGKPEEATKVLRKAIEKFPRNFLFRFNLAFLEIQLRDYAAAEGLVAELKKSEGVPRSRVEFLEATLLAQRDHDWDRASRELERLRPLLGDSRELTAQCDIQLARCYEALGDADKQLLTYRRVLKSNPFEVSWRLNTVVALLKRNRLNDALDECKQILAPGNDSSSLLPKPPEEAWSLYVNIQVIQAYRSPPELRRWDLIKETLDNALKQFPDSTGLTVLRAEVFASENDLGKAMQTLQQARTAHPDRIDFWTALADVESRQGKTEEALKTLAAAEDKLGDKINLRRAKLQIYTSMGLRQLIMRQPAAQAIKSIAALERGLDHFNAQEQVSFLIALALSNRQLDSVKDARRLWKEVATRATREIDKLEAQLQIFNLAMQANDDADMNNALAAAKQCEGEGGPFTELAEARYKTWQAKIEESKERRKKLLEEAREGLNNLEEQKRGWMPVSLNLAEIDELEGRTENAISNYQRAVDLGNHQVDVIERVVKLLFQKQRYADAEMALQKLPEQVPLSASLQQLESKVSLQNHEYTRALEQARKAVQTDPNSFQANMWLGEISWIVSQKEDLAPESRREAESLAEPALRRAVELAPDNPGPWVVLVEHLARIGKMKAAEEAVAGAEKKIAKDKSRLALAQCYAAINHLDRARQLHQIALKERPDDVSTLKAAAEFYIGSKDLGKAQECLQKIAGLGGQDPASAAWSVRILAGIAAAGQDYKKSHQLLSLLDSFKPNSEDVANSAAVIDWLRTDALVRANLPDRKNRQQALKNLERIGDRQQLRNDDRFLLAQLHSVLGDKAKARDTILPLLNGNADPRYLAFYIGMLLDQKQTAEADIWLGILEKQQPGAPVTASLKAKALKQEGKDKEAVALLKKKAEGKDLRLKLEIAGELERMNEMDAAEEIYRTYVNESKEPQAVLVMARFLGRRKQVSAALDLCEGAWKTCNPDLVAGVAAEIVHDPNTPPESYQRVVKWLQEGLRKYPEAKTLLGCLASVYENKGRYAEAENLYQKSIGLNDKDAVSLNNLAVLMVFAERKGAEALPLAQRAIEILGPLPELLDTQAMAYLKSGQTKKAIDNLEEATSRPNLDPKLGRILQFHLAEAYDRGNKKKEASAALQRARNMGLEPSVLNPLERNDFKNLVETLAKD
jgi:predicted Zn-dependent protease